MVQKQTLGKEEERENLEYFKSGIGESLQEHLVWSK